MITMNEQQTASSIKTVDPATNRTEKSFEEMPDLQIRDIFEHADKAFKSWRKTPFKDRKKLLEKVASLMRERKEELARLCAIEMGKRMVEGLAEVEHCANIFEYYAKHGEDFLADEKLRADTGKAFISHEPIGVILSIQPWNFPFYQMTRSAAPIVMAGNTIVMKQASNVPQCAAMMEQLFNEAGAPAGVYTNLFVSGSHATELIGCEQVKGVAFTGSEKAGSSIAAEAGRHVKRSILELGGSDAFVVIDDADLDDAVQMAAMGRLQNAGQICVSPKRIIVPAGMVEEFTSKAVAIYQDIKTGNPLDPDTQLAPLVSVEARDKVLKQIEDSVAAGAKLVYGGKAIDGEGAYMQPTILTNLSKGMVAYDEEVFGPVLCIFPARDRQEAIDIANDTKYGLGGTVFGKDKDDAIDVARQIDTGMVYINEVTSSYPELPFGGTKHSGYGREHWLYGIREFINPKLIRIAK